MVVLLDVNLLLALMWPAHDDHQRVHHWFERNSKAGWATCPFTQSAVVRILSNPAFSRQAVTVAEAIKILENNLQHPTHRFWMADISFVEAIKPFRKRLVGHKQIADAYLVGLAMHHRGKFATMDRSIATLLPENETSTSLVVI